MKAKFKAVDLTQYSSYQHCLRLRILGTGLISEILLGTRICSSNCVTFYEMAVSATLKDVL
jgi:hypothetical protein